MKLSLAFSPCPNDTFIFDALVNGRIDREGLDFEVYLADVEELNKSATTSKYDITKLSFAAYPTVSERYILMDSGSALGTGCGPLLVSLKGNDCPDKIKNGTDFLTAIPGEMTTANFLLTAAFPYIKSKKVMLFSEIEKAVLDGEVDAGLLIHENRFTYGERGLQKLSDLGEFWEKKTQMPIPLGGIAANRKLGDRIISQINKLINKSITYAFDHPDDSGEYVLAHAQEMSPAVVKSHIGLYVNHFSISLGEQGKSAIYTLYEQSEAGANTIRSGKPIFIQNV